MNFNNDEEELDFFNRLLDRLRQAGYDQHGSHFQLVYVAPGAQHVERQYQTIQTHPDPETHPSPETHPDPPWVGREKIPVAFPWLGSEKCAGELPEVLATPEAMALWRKAQRAGYVDEHYQPLISRTQAALLADAMAERLGITEKWKVFGDLWKRNNMRGDYTRAMNQRQSLGFQDKLKRLFSTDIEENTGET